MVDQSYEKKYRPTVMFFSDKENVSQSRSLLGAIMDAEIILYTSL